MYRVQAGKVQKPEEVNLLNNKDVCFSLLRVGRLLSRSGRKKIEESRLSIKMT